jgi:MYXO-CTERM domain-containing protein
MGKTLAGMKVKLRFRIGTDDAAGNYGWEVDNIAFKGITNTPFDSLVADMAPCGEVTTTSATTGSGEMVSSSGGVTVSSSGSNGVGGAASTGGSGGSGGSGTADQAFGGCGCFVGGSSSSPLFAAPLFLLSALLLRRRSSRVARSS